jgi:hypothetical protein
MATIPQTTPCHRHRIGEGWLLFRIPSRRAHRYDLAFDQAVCHQRHHRKQSQNNGCRSRNRQVAPLSLRFHAQMGTRFFERDFHAPTPHKPGQNLQRCVVDMRRKKGLRIVLALRVTHQDPAHQDRVEAGFVPHTGFGVDRHVSLLAAIPILDFQCRPRCVGIIETLLR